VINVFVWFSENLYCPAQKAETIPFIPPVPTDPIYKRKRKKNINTHLLVYFFFEKNKKYSVYLLPIIIIEIINPGKPAPASRENGSAVHVRTNQPTM
jgi:hypothetical protein